MKYLLLTATLLAPLPAAAQLPPAAYAGDFGTRLIMGFKCIPQNAVLPMIFGSSGEPAGVYWFAVPVSDVCVRGGSASGHQF